MRILSDYLNVLETDPALSLREKHTRLKIILTVPCEAIMRVLRDIKLTVSFPANGINYMSILRFMSVVKNITNAVNMIFFACM